jgi:hypothetical protein
MNDKVVEFRIASHHAILRHLVSWANRVSSASSFSEIVGEEGLDSSWRLNSSRDFRLSTMERKIAALYHFSNGLADSVLTLSGSLVSLGASLAILADEVKSNLEENADLRRGLEVLRTQVVTDEALDRHLANASVVGNGLSTLAPIVSLIPAVGPLLGAVFASLGASIIGGTVGGAVYSSLRGRECAPVIVDWTESMIMRYAEMDALINEMTSTSVIAGGTAEYLQMIQHQVANAFVAVDAISQLYADNPDLLYDLTPSLKAFGSRELFAFDDDGTMKPGGYMSKEYLIRMKWPVTIGEVSGNVHTYSEYVFILKIVENRSRSSGFSFNRCAMLVDVSFDNSTRKMTRTIVQKEGEVSSSSAKQCIADYSMHVSIPVMQTFVGTLIYNNLLSEQAHSLCKWIVSFACSKEFDLSSIPIFDSDDLFALMQSFHEVRSFGGHVLPSCGFITDAEALAIVARGGHDASGYDASFSDMLTDYDRAVTKSSLTEPVGETDGHKTSITIDTGRQVWHGPIREYL